MFELLVEEFSLGRIRIEVNIVSTSSSLPREELKLLDSWCLARGTEEIFTSELCLENIMSTGHKVSVRYNVHPLVQRPLWGRHAWNGFSGHSRHSTGRG